MAHREEFWDAYLPLLNEIKAKIHKRDVENKFRDLVKEIFNGFNSHNDKVIEKFPLLIQFEIVDLLKYNSDFNQFVKDFYTIYNYNLNMIMLTNGRKSFESFNDFTNRNPPANFYNFRDPRIIEVLNELKKVLEKY